MPDAITTGEPWPTMDEVRRRHLAATLKRCGGNKAEAARLLGVSLKTVYNWLAEERRADPETAYNWLADQLGIEAEAGQ